MAEQPRFDVLGLERLAQQGVGHEIDLADGEVVRGAPVGVQGGELLVRECGGRRVRVDGHPDPFRVGTAFGGFLRLGLRTTTFHRRAGFPTGPFGPARAQRTAP